MTRLKEKLRAKLGGRTPRRLRSEVAVTEAEAQAIAQSRGAHPSEPEDADPHGHESIRGAMHAATLAPPNEATLRPLTAPEEVADFAASSNGDMETFVTGGHGKSGMAEFVSGADEERTTDAIVGNLLGNDIESDDWLEVDFR